MDPGLSKTEEIQIDLYRGLGGEKRLKIAAELRELSLKIIEAGLHSAYPDWTQDKIRLGVIGRILPPEIFKKVYSQNPPC